MIASAQKPPRARIWFWLRVCLLIVSVTLFSIWIARTIGFGALIERLISELRSLGPAVFFGSMAILPAVGFPLLPFAVAAGPVFSPSLGVGGVVACTITAVCINVALSYALASSILRPPVQWLVIRWGYQLPTIAGHNPWIVTLLARLIPGPPFWMQSYALGVVRVSFVPYLVISTLVPASYLSAAIIFGDAMVRGKAGPALLAVGLLTVVGAGFHLLRKKLKATTATDPNVARSDH